MGRGLLRRSPLVLLGTALSVAVAVAFVAARASFIASTRADLTVRAATRVPVDWQVQLTAGADPAAVDTAVQALPDVRVRANVDSAPVPALTAAGPAGTRTTGQARV